MHTPAPGTLVGPGGTLIQLSVAVRNAFRPAAQIFRQDLFMYAGSTRRHGTEAHGGDPVSQRQDPAQPSTTRILFIRLGGEVIVPGLVVYACTIAA